MGLCVRVISRYTRSRYGPVIIATVVGTTTSKYP